MERQELKLVARIVENLPVMSSDIMQGWINNPKGLKKFLSGLVPPAIEPGTTITDFARWEANYEKLFGHKPDLSEICIPEKPEGVGPVRLIVVAKEIFGWTKARSLQGTQDALEAHFPCWQYDSNLDTAIPTNGRDPKNGSYAVWVKDVREADEEFANKSANDLKAESHTGITVLERQLFEVDYFFEKGEHLDRENVTLCSGSRYRDGGVPDAFWDGRFDVYWCRASSRDSYLRSRRVWA